MSAALVASYVEMIPLRVRMWLYVTGLFGPMIAAYTTARGWTGEPELVLAASYSGITNAIALAHGATTALARRRRPPTAPPADPPAHLEGGGK